MPRRPDTSETVMFALELLRRIPHHSKTTAASLHQELVGTAMERDIRTIQRQLESLSEHFDIERDDRSKPYGYRWKERSAGLSLHRLSEQDSLLLTLAEQYLRSLLPARLLTSMKRFFDQARTNLGPHGGAQLSREWLSKVRVVSESQPLLAPTIKLGILEIVSNALYGNQWLELDYRNASGKRKRADVMPLGLAQQGSRLYLVCRYRGFDNERSLALHRILAASVSSMGFERPRDFNLEKYDHDGRFGFGSGEQIQLTIRIAKPDGLHLLESRLSRDQSVLDHGDQYEIKATVVNTARLDWWLRGFGEAITHISKVAIVSNP